jgi:Na+:H+ antiporter, NhaA family
MSGTHPAHASRWPFSFISSEAAGGLVLLLAAAVALAWANSPLDHLYEALWDLRLSFGLGRFLPEHHLHFWVNEVLMTVFFLVVGLEIRREMHDGALSNARAAALPLLAAAGGVVAPALVYLAFNLNPVTRHGWAIPTATDIAFAVGVLSLVGQVPPAVRTLLLTLAIIDDIAAVLVIALFYSSGIEFTGVPIAAEGVLLVLLLQWLGVRPVLAYFVPAVIVWYGMLKSGVHPALAGVLLGLLTPTRVNFGLGRRNAAVSPNAVSPAGRLEALLQPWVVFGIMPLFALANAGVNLEGLDLHDPAPLTAGLGIVAGLALGKPIGILLAAFAALRLKLASLPHDVSWRHMLLMAMLGGIGFTMAMFIADLAFEDDELLLAAAKFAVLVGSCVAAVAAFVLGRLQRAALAPQSAVSHRPDVSGDG